MAVDVLTTETRVRKCSCGETMTHVMKGDEALEWRLCLRCGARTPFVSHVRMDVALTEYCNLRCQMCRRPMEANLLEAQRCKAILEEASSLGIGIISFSGGEPFIHPDVYDILEHALNLSLKVQVVTNGTLLRREHLDSLSDLDCITVSLDGLEQVHDKIRGRTGTFARVEQTIKWLSNSSICWGTNTVMQRDNAHQLYDLFKYVQRIGRERYAYCCFVHVEVVPDTLHLQMTPEQEEIAYKQIVRIARECDEAGIYFSDKDLLLNHFSLFNRKGKFYRPKLGCRIPQKFIGLSCHGFYLCWHTGRNIEAPSLVEALSTAPARDLVREGLEGRCIGCNTFNYSWDAQWSAGILESAIASETVSPG